MYIWEVIRKSGQLENVESRVARMMFGACCFTVRKEAGHEDTNTHVDIPSPATP